jgi:biotin synthase-like enzyme
MPYKNKHKQRDYQNKRIIKRRLEIDAYKVSRGCERCGYNTCGQALHFHHQNPEEKLNSIAELISQNRAMETIFAETTKCTILCANCHAELHGKLS